MKSLILIIIILCSTFAFAQGPKVHFFKTDGTSVEYNIFDIEDISIILGKKISLMQIFYQDSLMEKYQTKTIKTITFGKDSLNYDLLNVYVNTDPYIYYLSDIDSINFFVTEEPLPEIYSVNPLSGKVGDEITITGKNFGAVQGTSFLLFKNKKAAEYTKWTDTLIKVKVPKGTQSGTISVTVKGIKTNEIYFSVISYITSIEPTSGRYGTLVTIKGMSLGTSRGTNVVDFSGVNATEYTSWNDTIIKVKVPVGCKTGMVKVTIDTSKTNELAFSILHSISAVVPAAARIGDTVAVMGISFGSTKDSSSIAFNSLNVKDYISWSDTLVRVKVPVGCKTGKVNITIKKTKSNDVAFSVIPVITSISQDSAGISQNISLFGNGFGDTRGTGVVSLKGADAVDYITWTDSEIYFTVPLGTQSGKVFVTASGNKSNEVYLTTKVFITSITPSTAKIGDKVTLKGYKFGSTQGTSYVSFNNAICNSFQSWNDTSLTMIVPPGTNSGAVTITVDGVLSNGVIFAVIPVVAAIEPTSERIGSVVIITGEGFNDSKGSSVVTFNGGDASEYTSWNRTTIKVKVPGTAKNGKVSVTTGTQKSNEVDFSVLPSISGFFPTNGLVGDVITINGASFGATRGTSYVSFNGTNVVNYNSWSDRTIIVKVPPGATSGKVYAMIGSEKTNEVDFYLTPVITNINPNKANLGEQVTITGDNFGSTRGTSVVNFNSVEVSAYNSWSNTSIVITIPNTAVSGKVSVTVNGYKSNEVDFTVTSILIGTQEWMLSNLNVTTYRNGDQIPEVTDQTAWNSLTTGAWCHYSNSTPNGVIYGKLYNWYAVNDSRGLAPSGWHIPSDVEFTTLTTYLGGEPVAGGKLKEIGTSHWSSPNTGANNESGFTALGSGYRYSSGYSRLLEAAVFWSSTQSDADNANLRTLFYNSGGVTKPANPKIYGFSVRCLKN